MKKRVIAIVGAGVLALGGASMVGASSGEDSERGLRVKAPVTAYTAIPAPNTVHGVEARVRAETGEGKTRVSLLLRGFDRASQAGHSAPTFTPARVPTA